MVRAAASGVVDYTRADPKDINWRIRHQLLLREVQRQEQYKLIELVYRKQLALISHGRLKEESFIEAQDSAKTLLGQLQDEIFPWLATKTETETQKDTISDADAELIKRYRERMARAKREEDADAADTTAATE